jgi:hypothetical protein
MVIIQFDKLLVSYQKIITINQIQSGLYLKIFIKKLIKVLDKYIMKAI